MVLGQFSGAHAMQMSEVFFFSSFFEPLLCSIQKSIENRKSYDGEKEFVGVDGQPCVMLSAAFCSLS